MAARSSGKTWPLGSDGLGVLSCLAIYRLCDLAKSLSLSQLVFLSKKGK